MNDVICILLRKTKDFKEEYRVAKLDSVNSLFYDEILETETQDSIVILENARRLFKDSKVYPTREYAYKVAEELDFIEKTTNHITTIILPTTEGDF